MVGPEHLPAIGRTANVRRPNGNTQWKSPMSIFDLTGRVAVITGGNGGIGLGIAQALAAAGCNVSIWGRNAEKNKSAAATMAGCHGQGRHPHLRRQRSRFGQGGDGGHAGDIRPGRRLLCQCRHRRRRTARLHRPHRGTMAQDVRHQSRRRVPRVPGRGAAHDRTRRRPATASAGWSRPRASHRFSAPRATSIMPRPRPPSTRCAARSRSNWRARASPPTPSCPAGSRAT